MSKVDFNKERIFQGRENWDSPQFGDNERLVTGRLFVDDEGTHFIIDELQGDCDIYNFSHCAVPVDPDTIEEIGIKPEIRLQTTGYGCNGNRYPGTTYVTNRMAYCTKCDYDLRCIDYYGIKDRNYCEKCGSKIDWSEIFD